jgi:hypothetical protein
MAMEAEYHLIDLATGSSQRPSACAPPALMAWDIFRGNVHIEQHGPRDDFIS